MVIWVVFSLRIFIKLLMNIHIQINLWVYVFIFLGKNGTMESQGRCYICLTLRMCQTSFQSCYTILHSHLHLFHFLTKRWSHSEVGHPNGVERFFKAIRIIGLRAVSLQLSSSISELTENIYLR